MWIDAQGVSLWLVYFIAAPEPFHSFPKKKKKKGNWGRKWFPVLRGHTVSSPKHPWGDRNKYITRMLLCKSKEQQHPHLEGLVPRSLLELWAFIMVQCQEKWSAESVAYPQLGSNVSQTWGISDSRLILIHGLHNGYEFIPFSLHSPQAYMFTWLESVRVGKTKQLASS